MTRNDWLWLAVKVLGLWLVIQGVLALSGVVHAVFNWITFGTFVSAVVGAGLPLLFGVFLIRAGYDLVADEKKV